MPTITLTTDFGLSDWFVGTMKGVILSICPRATILDISHQIPPGDIRSAAFALAASYRFFPAGTVHVAVVDPGVGTSRKAIAVRTAKYLFVGPDNGTLSWALRKEKIKAIHALENEKYWRRPLSHTFHGRDVFAPVAAHLTRGLPVGKLGPALKNFIRLPWPEPIHRGNRIQGEVIYIDRFGNAITNINNEIVPRKSVSSCEIRVGTRRYLCPLKMSYQALPANALLAIPGSCGLLEIAINGDSAEKQLGLRVGTRITL